MDIDPSVVGGGQDEATTPLPENETGIDKGVDQTLAERLKEKYPDIVTDVHFNDFYVDHDGAMGVFRGRGIGEDDLGDLSKIMIYINGPVITDIFGNDPTNHPKRRIWRDNILTETPDLKRFYRTNKLRSNKVLTMFRALELICISELLASVPEQDSMQSKLDASGNIAEYIHWSPEKKDAFIRSLDNIGVKLIQQVLDVSAHGGESKSSEFVTLRTSE